MIRGNYRRVCFGSWSRGMVCNGGEGAEVEGLRRKWATDIPLCKQEVGEAKLLTPPPVACFLQEGSTPKSTTNQRTLGLNLRAHWGPSSFKLPYLLSRKLVHFMRPPVNPSEGCPLDRITLHKAFPVKGYITSAWLC